MTYLSGRSQKRKKYLQYGILTGVFLVLLIFWPFVRKHMYPALEPVTLKYGSTKQSFSLFPEFFRTYVSSHQELVTQQKKLEIEIENLENKIAEQEALLSESQEASAVSLGDTTKKVPLVLYPLMQDVTRIYSTVLLSKGFKDGVDIGDTVYVRGNQAVCAIKEVYTSSALCLLLTASGVATDAVTSSSITLSLVGRGGYYLGNVVRDTPVTVGEKVYLRSNPKMILGTVKEVANNNQDTSWHVFVEGAYNPVTSSLFYVQP